MLLCRKKIDVSISKLGGKVCIVEKNGFGGTCTQRGCIPTKYLHSVADIIRKMSMSKAYGIDSKTDLNYKILKSKMFTTVAKLASGIELLLKDNGVEIVEGEAEIISSNKVKVYNKILETKSVVIATGSIPVSIAGFDFKEKIHGTQEVIVKVEFKNWTKIKKIYVHSEFPQDSENRT